MVLFAIMDESAFKLNENLKINKRRCVRDQYNKQEVNKQKTTYRRGMYHFITFCKFVINIFYLFVFWCSRLIFRFTFFSILGHL